MTINTSQTLQSNIQLLSNMPYDFTHHCLSTHTPVLQNRIPIDIGVDRRESPRGDSLL